MGKTTLRMGVYHDENFEGLRAYFKIYEGKDMIVIFDEVQSSVQGED